MIPKDKISESIHQYSFMLLFFVLTFGYFLRFGNYILFFQENQSLFLSSGQYLYDFLIKPGGLLVYSGKFLTQFYHNEFTGALILASIITSVYYLSIQLLSFLKFDQSYARLFALIPACSLVLMQSHYYHFMEMNLGVFSVLLYLIAAIYLQNKKVGFLVPVLFPAFYYLAGAFAWIFVAAYITYLLICTSGKQKYMNSLIVVFLSFLVIFTSGKLFLQPKNLLLSYPLHSINDTKYRIISYVLSGYFILVFPLSKLTLNNKLAGTWAATAGSLILLLLAAFGLYKNYNPQTDRVLQTEKYVYEQKWDDAIRFSEKYPSGNLIGQYYFNIALSESGQLCDNLFAGRQNFGVNSLILPWGNEHLSFGADFYYTIGLVNEAHRWAYEDMVVNGQKPANMKLLVKTNLINGNIRMAEKYINILKNTHYYKDWALEYEKMATDTTLINSNTELKRQKQNMPKGDFFIQVSSPQNNIPLLWEANPTNKRAFEYKMAWLLLSKDIEGTVSQIKSLKTLGYTRIPRHIEEAVMIYYNAKGAFPDLGGLSVSNETLSRFDQYVAAFKVNRQNMALAKERMGALFGNTFMYFYHFN
jgi:hypothetical protein